MRYRIYLALLFAFLLALVIGQPVLQSGFIVLDDPNYVSSNRMVLSGLNWSSFKWALRTTHHGNWFPLTWISYMLDCELFTDIAFGMHLSNLFYHCIASLLFFLFLYRSTEESAASLLAALLFLLHPLHVEAVAWISGRKDVLSGLMWMAVLNMYAYYRVHPKPKRYALLLVSYCLALATKPNLIMLPCVLLALDIWPLGTLSTGLNRNALFKLVVEKLPLLFCALLLGLITYFSQSAFGVDLEAGRLSLGTRVGNAAIYYLTYLKRTLWPFGLAIQYPHPLASYLWWQSVGAVLALTGISALVVFLRFRAAYLLTGWCWFMLALLPNVQLTQIGNQATADRYMYVPLAGLAIAIAWTLLGGISASMRPTTFIRNNPTRTAVALVLVLYFALPAQLLASTWNSSISVFQRAVLVTGPNYRAHMYLGDSYLREGQLNAALGEYQTALQIQPLSYFAFTRLTALLKRRDELHTLAAYLPDPSLLKDAPYPDLIAAGNMYYQLQKHSEARARFVTVHGIAPQQLALEYLQTAVKLEPADEQSFEALQTIAILLLQDRKFEQAADQLERLIQQQPRRAHARLLLALCYFETGKFAEARLHAEQAYALSPRNQEAQQLLKKIEDAYNEKLSPK